MGEGTRGERDVVLEVAMSLLHWRRVVFKMVSEGYDVGIRFLRAGLPDALRRHSWER